MNIDDIDIRKTVVHGVNKVDIIDAEMSGYESPTSQVFSRNAPRGPAWRAVARAAPGGASPRRYCDLDLTPHFDYDLEKAQLLNCASSGDDDDDDDDSSSSMVPVIILVVLLALALVFVCFMAKKEKDGEPVFSAVSNPMNKVADEKA